MYLRNDLPCDTIIPYLKKKLSDLKTYFKYADGNGHEKELF